MILRLAGWIRVMEMMPFQSIKREEDIKDFNLRPTCETVSVMSLE